VTALTPRLGEAQAQGAALRRLSQMVEQQALVLAYNDVLVAMSLLFAAALPLVLLLSRPKPGGGGGH
jgi:DHA2 family multidrug resistance protein